MEGSPTLWPATRALMLRDLRLLWRRRGDALQPALFALLVVVLFALALGAEAQTLAKVASAVLWLASDDAAGITGAAIEIYGGTHLTIKP